VSAFERRVNQLYREYSSGPHACAPDPAVASHVSVARVPLARRVRVCVRAPMSRRARAGLRGSTCACSACVAHSLRFAAIARAVTTVRHGFVRASTEQRQRASARRAPAQYAEAAGGVHSNRRKAGTIACWLLHVGCCMLAGLCAAPLFGSSVNELRRMCTRARTSWFCGCACICAFCLK
jgi:hypothetical protein